MEENSNDDYDNNDLILELNIDNCSQQQQSEAPTYSENCSSYVGVCNVHLENFTGVTNNKLTTANSNIIIEEEIVRFLTSLETFSSIVSEECSAIVMPFICQYAYPPCDRNGSPLLITQEQCVNIRDDVCVNEWRIAGSTDLRSLLPVCEVLSSENTSRLLKSKKVLKPLKCHYQFKEFCGTCLPICGTFSQYSDETLTFETSLVVASIIVAFLGGTIAIIAAIVKHESMLVFPQVLVIYNICSALIIAMFSLINYIGGQESLYCSHETIHYSLKQPTTYSQLSGFFFHFCIQSVVVTWFLHVLHLFLGVAFPFWARFLNEKKWKIRCHVIEVIGGITFCSLGPTLVVTFSEYTIASFPTLFPLPTKKMVFFTMTVPLSVLLATGVNMIFHTFFSVHKNAGLIKREDGQCITFSVPEVKILLLLCYCMIIGVISLINLTVAIDDTDLFLKDLTNYFICHLGGDDPMCEQFRREFEKHDHVKMNVFTYFLIALITWVDLLFSIHSQDVKWMIQKMSSVCSSKNTKSHTCV
ncbi:uncharacterized protein [Dysidea avara]|uniref:uncharacterized protein isoform X2 n=1 Tax=Dysidea avara TaxID=196820 RepID=UPI00332A76F0